MSYPIDDAVLGLGELFPGVDMWQDVRLLASEDGLTASVTHWGLDAPQPSVEAVREAAARSRSRAGLRADLRACDAALEEMVGQHSRLLALGAPVAELEGLRDELQAVKEYRKEVSDALTRS